MTTLELELLARVQELTLALAPFARVARGIPGNWPGQCVLTVDSPGIAERVVPHRPMYFGTSDMPTIANYREALRVYFPGSGRKVKGAEDERERTTQGGNMRPM